jgi:hypothetical protein
LGDKWWCMSYIYIILFYRYANNIWVGCIALNWLRGWVWLCHWLWGWVRLCHWLYVRHLYFVSFFFWWGTYMADMLYGIINSYCIQKQILKTKRNLKKLTPIWGHISRILPTSTLHGSFVRYWNSEFPLSLKSLWNSLWLWYSEFPLILHQLSLNPKVRSYVIRFK